MGSKGAADGMPQTVVCLGLEPTGDAFSRGVVAFDLDRFNFENRDLDDSEPAAPQTPTNSVSPPPPIQLGGLLPPRAPKPQQPPQLGSALMRSAPGPQLADEGMPERKCQS
mmetsp:Transcript_24995/g.58882  ORF Transcript_24995/g.58882 Transcript_24995/m.58882 type:complete len:111 (-) Transcript_24995:258-590(-)